MASRRFVPTALALVFGSLSGLAYPRFDFWPVIFVSVAGMLWLFRDRSPRSALWLGFVAGQAFYVAQVYWLSQYLGPIPLFALSTLEAAIFSIGALALNLTWRLFESRNGWRGLVAPLALACVWSLREWVAISWPYGGFPWSRLAMSQSASPLANWAYLGGLPLLSLVVAAIGGYLLLVVERLLAKPEAAAAVASRAIGLAAPLAVILALLAVPLVVRPPVRDDAGSMRIAAVQGNANAGLFANPVAGSIFEKHLRASATIVQRSDDYKPEATPDLVVWPENAVDINPERDSATAVRVNDFVSTRLRAPLLFGTITQRGVDLFNSSVLWLPNRGEVARYDKQRPVPFAEFVPDRDFWYALAPDLIGLISHGYTFGTASGVMSVANHSVGVNICFEIAIDDLNNKLVTDGAQVLISQTNNSDFGHSDETYQQAAIARLRAIEFGRTVVNDSTVGVTAVFAADGSVMASIPAFRPGAIVADVPLSNAKTPAFFAGGYVALGANLVGIFLAAAGLAAMFRQRRKASAPQ